jgi:hypothetical protein
MANCGLSLARVIKRQDTLEGSESQELQPESSYIPVGGNRPVRLQENYRTIPRLGHLGADVADALLHWYSERRASKNGLTDGSTATLPEYVTPS